MSKINHMEKKLYYHMSDHAGPPQGGVCVIRPKKFTSYTSNGKRFVQFSIYSASWFKKHRARLHTILHSGNLII